MRTRELVGILAAVLFCVVVTIGTVIELLVGAEVEDAGGTIGWGIFFGLVALGCLIYTRRSLKKQGVPLWCSAQAGQFHKFKETGDPYEEPRIWECSVCGVHRKVDIKRHSSGNGE
jgi:hypothetical protein